MLELLNRLAPGENIDRGYFSDRVRQAAPRALPELRLMTRENMEVIAHAVGVDLAECDGERQVVSEASTLFCHITQNWRGKPLRTWETVVELIGHTRTATGLRVKAQLDKRRYPLGAVISNADMRAIELREHTFHGDWNYEVAPRRS